MSQGNHTARLARKTPKFNDVLAAARTAREKYFPAQDTVESVPGGQDTLEPPPGIDPEKREYFLQAEETYVALKMLEHLGAGDAALKKLTMHHLNRDNGGDWMRSGKPDYLPTGYATQLDGFVNHLNDDGDPKKAPRNGYSTDNALKVIDAAISQAMGIGKSARTNELA